MKKKETRVGIEREYTESPYIKMIQCVKYQLNIKCVHDTIQTRDSI